MNSIGLTARRTAGGAIRLRPDDDPTYLYRLYDADDALLYVGIAFVPTLRWREHRLTKYWWKFVARHTLDLFPTRTEAKAAELAAIEEERPLFNKMGSALIPRRQRRERIVEAELRWAARNAQAVVAS